jgi:hypothetical protein
MMFNNTIILSINPSLIIIKQDLAKSIAKDIEL